MHIFKMYCLKMNYVMYKCIQKADGRLALLEVAAATLYITNQSQ